ncbi:hypothetical protein [Rhizobium mongolense]|uniref:Uncharacterized protein n=2 Tax=Rhizobium mongolense TaxID=57676 RepID=A0ABR6IQ68_9HYPH|nr:hypothetical protein [Rhizobium mongolense]MBB4230033.1 hypothetical protein [Rhizobium mongolense]TVZ72835.1 hypothetical protein BCL32_1022 [Rhizobium mongolense USDA 1844]
MTDEGKIERGTAADRICSDPVYQGAWESIMRDLYKAWVESPLDDVAGRERQRLELDVLTRLKGKFLSYMNEAAMVKAEAE